MQPCVLHPQHLHDAALHGLGEGNTISGMKAYEFIEDYTTVLARFGQWPDFHDGEVHRIVLDRTHRDASGAHVPTLEIDIRGWIMGPEVTEKGCYVLHHDAVVSFLFEDIFDLELEGFSQQNVLTSLELSLIEDPAGVGKALHAELEHCDLFAANCTFRTPRIRQSLNRLKSVSHSASAFHRNTVCRSSYHWQARSAA
jgi:hypothetical protein